MARTVFENFMAMVGPMVVINLPQRADRKAEFAAQLDHIGLSLDHPDVRVFAAIRPTDAGGFPTVGTRGCFLSHLAVLRETADSAADSVLICEDDLDFGKDILARLPAIIATLDAEPWDIFYGGYTEPPAGEEVAPGIVRARARDGIMCMHFYAVRGQAIHDLVAYLDAILLRPPGHPDGGPMHVDGGISRFRADHPHYVTLAAVPPIGSQRSSRTDIHDLKWFDRWPLVRNLTGKLRRLRAARDMQ